MTAHVAIPRDVGTWLLGSFVVTLGVILIFITLMVSYDILFGLGLGWTTSAILSIFVLCSIAVLWAPMILLIFNVMQSLYAIVPDLSTFGFRVPGRTVPRWET